MKSELNNYSELLIEEIRGGTEVHSAVSKLKKLLARRRHQTILGAVLRKAEKIVSESRDYSEPTLIVASEKDAKKYEKTIGKRPEPVVIIDPEIVGGYIVREDYVMTDSSYRSKLVNWYRKSIQN